MRNSKAIPFSDFSGGLNTLDSSTTIANNQAVDLDNIVLLPKSGFDKRNGNSAFNSSAMASGASVHGLAYYRQADADEWLTTICGTKIFKSEFDGTMDDITGGVTITAGNNNIWTNVTMNDLAIYVGGARGTDVPLKWTGAGNAAILGGTPPVGEFCFIGNNRLFIGNTIANPSRVNWSILGNPEDWAGAGSGSQDISTNDGDTLIGASLVGPSHVLLFKQNSIHDMIISSSPFPVFPLFRGVGAVSKRGIVDVDGIAYFITPEPRMKATDGTKIMDFPDSINPLWDSLSKSRLQYIQGLYDRRRRLILWFCSSTSSSTNDICIVWDLNRKAWLKFSTGHKMNCAALMNDRSLYGGAYDGKVYKLDDSTKTDDASEATPAVTGYWRSGWIDMQSMIQSKNFPYVVLNYSTQTTGNFTFSYGFDFSADRKSEVVSMVNPGAMYGSGIYGADVYGGLSDKTKLLFMKGNGNFFQFLIKNGNSGQSLSFNRMEIPVKGLAPTAVR